MTLFQRIRSVLIGLVMLIVAILFIAYPIDELYLFLMIILAAGLMIRGISDIVFYFTMAKHMVGGKIILFQGVIIGFLGTSIGSALGILIVVFRDGIADLLSWIMGHDVFPPELYHLRRIPALITAGDMTLILLMSLAICIFAAIIPAIYASLREPAKSLQEEA